MLLPATALNRGIQLSCTAYAGKRIKGLTTRDIKQGPSLTAAAAIADAQE